MGIPVPNCEVKLVDLSDPSKEVATGETGEFAVRGPMIFAGYWEKPNETEKAFHDGWFLTGDVVKMDEKGWFYVVDRKKDMIIASGFKVWPRDVEDVLYKHHAVKEAAVVGVPHPYRGETVRAYVSLKEGLYGDGGRADPILQGANGRLQIPSGDHLPEGIAQDGDGQVPAPAA